MLNITILSSTRGTYLPALHQNLQTAGITINEVVSNNPAAGIIAKARNLGLSTVCIPSASPNFEATLTKRLEQTSTDLLVLLGFMKILSKS